MIAVNTNGGAHSSSVTVGLKPSVALRVGFVIAISTMNTAARYVSL